MPNSAVRQLLALPKQTCIDLLSNVLRFSTTHGQFKWGSICSGTDFVYYNMVVFWQVMGTLLSIDVVPVQVFACENEPSKINHIKEMGHTKTIYTDAAKLGGS